MGLFVSSLIQPVEQELGCKRPHILCVLSHDCQGRIDESAPMRVVKAEDRQITRD